MAKNLKLNIKNTQIAEAINLGNLKKKLAKKKETSEPKESASQEIVEIKPKPETEEHLKSTKEEAAPRIRARSKSAFAEGQIPDKKIAHGEISQEEQEKEISFETPAETEEQEQEKLKSAKKKSSEELRKEIFGEDFKELLEQCSTKPTAESIEKPSLAPTPELFSPIASLEQTEPLTPLLETPPSIEMTSTERAKLGPTGKHIKDLLPPKQKPQPQLHVQPIPPLVKSKPAEVEKQKEAESRAQEQEKAKSKLLKPKSTKARLTGEVAHEEESPSKKGLKTAKVKEFKDFKPGKQRLERGFDARDRQGLRDVEEEQIWRRKRAVKTVRPQEDVTIRPTHLTIRTPITIKDLAGEMKLKASQLIGKLFLQGIVVTLNDTLEDETTIQLLGQEFGCEITIDSSEEKRIRITDKTIKEEIQSTDPSLLSIRAPVVAFMGHVDHGKTSLIDTIRKSNRAANEAGDITQHIGAFRCSTPVGDIAILDTPGHEAFSAMRARGADVTDIVVLVVAGDEGMRQQTYEAMQHAKAANVTIVVAINKSDKPNFNPELVYRQLADQELLPEVWGGQTITVNCSAVTGEGIKELLEMLALQSEVLELRANSHTRARGRVLESEMHKGMGAVTTVLVQNGTLILGDSLVFDQYWGRVKTMRDEYGRDLQKAGPSTPVEITGLSGLPEAGQEFIVVKNERDAREIAEARMQGIKQTSLQLKKKVSVENLFQQASEGTKKILNVILRADVQGSIEALKAALMKIQSTKADLNIIFAGVGEVSESDIQLAAASKAVIIGFHTQIESHADALIKQLGIQVRMHDIIYHAIDDVKALLTGLLDKIAQETDKGKAIVKATFKSSQYGIIAGCQVTEGSIHRNHHIRVIRNQTVLAKCPISSLKRVKEDVREVQKGLECGIVLNGFSEFIEGDILEAYEITYITQEL